MKFLSNIKIVGALLMVGALVQSMYAADDTRLHGAIIEYFANPSNSGKKDLLAVLRKLHQEDVRTASKKSRQNGLTPLDVYIKAQLSLADEHSSVRDSLISDFPGDRTYEFLFTNEDVKALEAIQNGNKEGDNARYKVWLERVEKWKPKRIFDSDSILVLLPKKIQKLLKGLDFAKEEANAKAKKKGFWRNVKSKMRGAR